MILGHVELECEDFSQAVQTTLGGNSVTHLLCTLSGAVEYATETLSTLNFGARSCKVVNQIVKVQQVSTNSTQIGKIFSSTASTNRRLDRVG